MCSYVMYVLEQLSSHLAYRYINSNLEGKKKNKTEIWTGKVVSHWLRTHKGIE